ncbi:MAG TPA: ATP-binding protein [Gammaproteobacteria bacterium]|jgi:hypothetical protein|nr:ATP-binding protein [Gammaproteobacteria bacterium]
MNFKEIKTIEDLDFLKENKVSESIDIDYKEKLPDFSNDISRLDFLRDICSFANTHGGQLIYGIKEERGKAIPQEIYGVELAKSDYDIRKIIDIVRDSLDVTLAGVRYTIIPLSSGKFVVIIYIPISMTPPHRVKANLDKEHRFYGRNDRGKYELSFYEIRDKFMQSTTIREKIRNFRQERFSAIKDGQGATELSNESKMVLHIIPFSSFSSTIECDPAPFKKLYTGSDTYPWFSPFGHSQINTNSEINLDGFLSYNNQGYVQFYREGIVEAVSILPSHNDDDTVVHSSFYEHHLLKQNYLSILKRLGFSAPFCIFLSMIGIGRMRFSYSSGTGYGAYTTSKREYNKPDILLKEVVLDSFDNSLDVTFRPLFDRFCNAWGLQNCMNYNEDGTYNFNRK